MPHLDDLPKRGANRCTQELSEAAFRTAISECEAFIVQSEDKFDYGTDFQIEATHGGAMTNARVHVQLKGTSKETNANGSVSVSIRRTNLNYLAMSRGSILVCYHVPSDRLLVKRVDDVLREYQHSGKAWDHQSTVTIRFEDDFDGSFQAGLKDYVVASASAARDTRIDFATRPPESLPFIPDQRVLDLPVPADPELAAELLLRLYEQGNDRTISRSFDNFQAILGVSNKTLMYAYMAEINLGVNGQECSKSRIADGIKVISNEANEKYTSKGSLLYCKGNGWLALGEHEKAVDVYFSALKFLEDPDSSQVAAQCCKNLGSTLDKLDRGDEAHAFYKRALELDANLAEAHFALALWHMRRDVDLDRALQHLDAIVWSVSASERSLLVLGWRADLLFRQGKFKEAFRDIHALLGNADEISWIWPWCARLVAIYGRESSDSTCNSARFWERFLAKFPSHSYAQSEKLLCIWMIHANGGDVACVFDEFKRAVAHAVAGGAQDPAFLWDRAGHWAQDEENWLEAEDCYRKAYEISPPEYGYCLGTALNFLDRHEEALPILLDQAREHLPDAKSWFQVALAMGKTGKTKECISAYKRALELDEDYDLAWFNLGWTYWKSERWAEALETWGEAVRRFPEHRLTSRLLIQFSDQLRSLR